MLPIDNGIVPKTELSFIIKFFAYFRPPMLSGKEPTNPRDGNEIDSTKPLKHETASQLHMLISGTLNTVHFHPREKITSTFAKADANPHIISNSTK